MIVTGTSSSATKYSEVDVISAAPQPDPRRSTPEHLPVLSGGPMNSSFSGRWTVIGMLMFGVVIVGGLWAYWEAYTRPFRPLQQAISRAFPGTRAYIAGGRVKSHLQDSPATLRIVLQQANGEFDPQENERESLNRAIGLYQLASQYEKIGEYQNLEVHLLKATPEKPTSSWSLRLPLSDWPALKPIPDEAKQESATVHPN